MMRRIISLSVLAINLLCVSSMMPRTVFNSGEGTFVAGKIVGRVETILNDLSLSTDKKKELLTGELVHAEQLHLTAISAKIRAYLSLTTVQSDELRSYTQKANTSVINGELPLQTALLGESDEQNTQEEEEKEPEQQPEAPKERTMLSAEDISSFGGQVIQEATNYSDRMSISGVPSVSQHRLASLALFITQVKLNTEVRARASDAVAVCKKIYQLLEENHSLISFIASFKKHMATKYESADEGIEGDIKFKVFEISAYPPREEDMTVADVVGDFLASYNSYVGPENKMTEEDVAFPAREWASRMLESDSVVKHIMLLVSFALEQVKHDVQRVPLMKQLRDGIQGQLDEAAALLSSDGVEITDTERHEPLALATKCSEYVQTILSSGGPARSMEQSDRVEKYVNIADQINQLTSDYDMVVREMADTAALERLSSNISQLSDTEQQLLKESSSIDQTVLTDMVPAFNTEESTDNTEFSGFQPRKKKRSVAQKVGMGIGICAAIIVVLWQAIPMALQWKEDKQNGSNGHNLWDLLSAPDAIVPTPIGAAAIAANKLFSGAKQTASGQ